MTPDERKRETTMRDFDTDQASARGRRLGQDFTFTLGGETFELRHGLKVGSTALNEWDPVLDRMLAKPDDIAAWPETHDGEAWKLVDDDEFLIVWRETMLGILKPGQEAALERILADEVSPLMLPDMIETIMHAVRVVTGSRPTGASSASSGGSTAPNPERADSSSRGDSSSPADAPSEI